MPDPLLDPGPDTGSDVAGAADAWVDGWTRMRGLSCEHVLGRPRVLVASASRETELVCVDPDPETWARLLATIVGDPRAMLTVVSARAPDYAERLPPGVRVDRDDETLMTRSLDLAPTTAPTPPGFDVEVEDLPTRHRVQLVSDRSVAAEGSVGVHESVATYDAVETGRRHRRQGLARWVMGELDAWAVAAGARTGILVATPQGAALYSERGWRPLAPMRSLMGRDP